MFEEAAPAQAPVAPAATETTLDGEDDDASGPSILLRAAAEMIVDEAERHRHIDAAEALLGLIPSVDLETSIIHGHWLLFFRAGRATPSATQCWRPMAVPRRPHQLRASRTTRASRMTTHAATRAPQCASH